MLDGDGPVGTLILESNIDGGVIVVDDLLEIRIAEPSATPLVAGEYQNGHLYFNVDAEAAYMRIQSLQGDGWVRVDAGEPAYVGSLLSGIRTDLCFDLGLITVAPVE